MFDKVKHNKDAIQGKHFLAEYFTHFFQRG